MAVATREPVLPFRLRGALLMSVSTGDVQSCASSIKIVVGLRRFGKPLQRRISSSESTRKQERS